MTIDRTPGVVPVPPVPSSTDRPAARAPAPSEPTAAPTPRRDTVEISAQGRRLAGLDDAQSARVYEVRERISGDYYSAPGVLKAIAQRLLTSGDL